MYFQTNLTTSTKAQVSVIKSLVATSLVATITRSAKKIQYRYSRAREVAIGYIPWAWLNPPLSYRIIIE